MRHRTICSDRGPTPSVPPPCRLFREVPSLSLSPLFTLSGRTSSISSERFSIASLPHNPASRHIPNQEPLDMNQKLRIGCVLCRQWKVSDTKAVGDCASTFIWASRHVHHDARNAVLAHSGEALQSRLAFQAMSPHEQDYVIEFLKSLQILSAAGERFGRERRRKEKEMELRH